LCRFSTSPAPAGSVAFIQRLCTSLILLHRWPGHNAFALPAASLPDLSALFSSSQPVLPAPLSRRVNNSVFTSPASPGMRSTCSTEVLNCAPRSFRGARSPWRRKIRSPSSDGAREVKTCATNPAIVRVILARIYEARTCNVGGRGIGYRCQALADDSDFSVVGIPNNPWDRFDEEPSLERSGVSMRKFQSLTTHKNPRRRNVVGFQIL
jgi:hypothetical protein